MKKLFGIFLGIAIIFIVSFYIIFCSNYVMPWNKDETIKTTLKWGGLKELPKNSKIITLEKRGSIFTRQFIIEFISPENDIKNWIKSSKRLKNNPPKFDSNKTIYEIYPGEDDSYGGKVEIKNDTIKINMGWS